MLAMLLLVVDSIAEADNLTLLVRTYQGRMYNRAYRILNNAEDAEDAVQQVFLGFVKNHSAPDAGVPWCAALLYVAVDNKAKNILKIRNKTQIEDVDPQNLPEGGVSNEEIIAVRDTIARLPEELREVLILSFYGGYTTREIAAYQNVKQDTVQKRIKRAKQQLKEMLSEEQDK